METLFKMGVGLDNGSSEVAKNHMPGSQRTFSSENMIICNCVISFASHYAKMHLGAPSKPKAS